MAYGILSAAQHDLDTAERLMRQNVGREYQRNQLKNQMEQREKAERTQMIGMGGGLGLRYGMSDSGKEMITGGLNKMLGPEETVIPTGQAAGDTVAIIPDATGSYAASPVATGALEGGEAISASPVPNMGLKSLVEGGASKAAGAATDIAATEAAETAATGALTGAAETAATGAATGAATEAATTAATTAAAETAGAAGGAAAGSELGSFAGPIGMVGGAVLGMALNSLFD